eukprot:TRINITY_DN67405_c9_g6_i2.p1 TRINITY_DN67405_c9_g6~~TRINITY_DN67405_c9_g6_i2.p1  ORF type:complete len:106 (+),score=7.29 TRINITY_DN67405_c9_g6_i2:797-1114(+)
MQWHGCPQIRTSSHLTQIVSRVRMSTTWWLTQCDGMVYTRLGRVDSMLQGVDGALCFGFWVEKGVCLLFLMPIHGVPLWVMGRGNMGYMLWACTPTAQGKNTHPK